MANWEFTLAWCEAGPPDHHDDEADSDQKVVNKELSLSAQASCSYWGHTLHPTPLTLHPRPYTLHPTPLTLHPTPYTLHPTPCTIDLTLLRSTAISCTLQPTPYTPHPTPYTLHTTPHTPHPTPYTLHLRGSRGSGREPRVVEEQVRLHPAVSRQLRG